VQGEDGGRLQHTIYVIFQMILHFEESYILSFPAYVESQILAPSGCSYVKLQELLFMTDPFRKIFLQIFTHGHGLSQSAK